MKILVIAPNPFFIDRGFSVRVLDQVQGLKEKGHQILVTAYNSGRDIPGIDIKRIPDVPGYGAEELGAKWSRLYLDILLLFTGLRQALIFKPDVIHAHLHEGGLIGILIGRLIKKPVLLDAQGSLTGELKDRGTVSNKLLLAFFKLIEKFIVKHSSYVVVSSPVQCENLVNGFGARKERLEVLVDGVDVKAFDRRTEPLQNNVPPRSDPKETVVVYVGILHPYYGTDCLLESIEYIIKTKRQGNIRFNIAGYPDAEKYKKIAAEKGILDKITFSNRINYGSLALYLSSADVAVAPKLGGTESSGKLFHYMAASLPVICFDEELNCAVLGDDGIYARSGDPVSLAEKIIYAHNNRSLLKAAGARLRTRVIQRYSLGGTIDKLVDIYSKMMKEAV